MLLKLFTITFFIGYLLHVFISGSIRLVPLTRNYYRRRTHFLGLFCFSIVALSPLLWLITFAHPQALIDTNDQLIASLWNCAVIAAPIIAVGCIVYLHKVLLSYEDQLPYPGEDWGRSNPIFRRKDNLPIRIKRRFASATPIKTLNVMPARVPPPFEQPDFEDTRVTRFQQGQTSPIEKVYGQD